MARSRSNILNSIEPENDPVFSRIRHALYVYQKAIARINSLTSKGKSITEEIANSDIETIKKEYTDSDVKIKVCLPA